LQLIANAEKYNLALLLPARCNLAGGGQRLQASRPELKIPAILRMPYFFNVMNAGIGLGEK